MIPNRTEGGPLSLAAKSFSLFSRDVFLFFTNLVTGVVIARKLGPEMMGLWIILQMIPAYAETFGRFKFDIAAVYLLGKKKYRVADVVKALNMLALLTSAVMVIPLAWKHEWFCSILFKGAGGNVTWLYFVILAQIPVHFVYMNYSYLYIYRENVRVYNQMMVIKALVSSLLAICLLLVFNAGLVAVVAASVLSVVIGMAYGIVRFGCTGERSSVRQYDVMKDLMKYGVKLYSAGIIGYFNAYLSQMLVVLLLPAVQVAFFGMAQSRALLLEKIPNAINIIVYPRVSKSDTAEESITLVTKSFRVMMLVLSAACVIGVLLIYPLVRILYGEEYLPMVKLFLVIMPGLALYGAASVMTQYFTGIGRAALCVCIAVVPLVTQLILLIVLVPRIGSAGAAFSYSVSLAAFAAMNVFVFVRISHCRVIKDLLIRKEDCKLVKSFCLKKYTNLGLLFSESESLMAVVLRADPRRRTFKELYYIQAKEGTCDIDTEKCG